MARKKEIATEGLVVAALYQMKKNHAGGYGKGDMQLINEDAAVEASYVKHINEHSGENGRIYIVNDSATEELKATLTK